MVVKIYELASKLLVCGNGGNHLGCPVSFCRSGRYRFGVSFFRVPVSFCSSFNISLLIEQPSLPLYNNSNFDPGSYRDYGDYIGVIGIMEKKMETTIMVFWVVVKIMVPFWVP